MSPRQRKLEPEEIEELEVRNKVEEVLYGGEGRGGYTRRQLELIDDLRAEEREEYEFEIKSMLGPAATCKHKFVDVYGMCENCGFWVGPDLTEDYDDR
jgi:hypothetical protein